MRCILMNKNTKVALIEYDTYNNAIVEIYDLYDIKYAPLSLENATHSNVTNLTRTLNGWFKNRGIPSWRKDVERLLEKLNVTSREELLNKAFALSLSDQYWIKEENENIKWKDINFFTNDFEYKAYLEVSFSNTSNVDEVSLHSPNNTTDGMLQKAWTIENGKRILVKGTYENSMQEPINEWLGSNISKRLGFDYCNYDIDIINNRIVSKCVNFLESNQEIITANDIYMSEKQDNNTSDFDHYINTLEKHNVPNAKENVENMFILDYLIMNYDRHLKNYGIIRNVDTLQWEKVTPIFDNGEAMQCNKLISEMNFFDGQGKFFKNTDKLFSTYFKNINITRTDIKALNGLSGEYYDVLKKYQKYTDISDERIDKLVNGIETRVLLLEKEINRIQSRTIDNIIDLDIDITEDL